jgi:hypothetical protein
MYCKLFASLYQGTLRGQANEILVFTNLLAHCDAAGFVDKHFRAIAEETGLDVEKVKCAITTLESPDPESRSAELGGARIERIDSHRVWGWRVVNFLKYRSIRDAEDRKEQNRLAQARFRNKEVSQSKPASAKVSQGQPCQPKSAHAEAEAEAEAVITLTGEFAECNVPTWSEVKAEAEMRAIPEASAKAFFDHHENNSLWINQFQRLINWKSKLTTWSVTDRQPKKQNANHRPTTPDRNAGTYNAAPLSEAAKSKVR